MRPAWCGCWRPTPPSRRAGSPANNWASSAARRALPALGDLLKSEETAGIACLALTTYPPGKADEILRAALPSRPGAARIQIINTLGDRRDAKAVKLLAQLASDADLPSPRQPLRRWARSATGPPGRPSPPFSKDANPALQTALTEATLRCAERLAGSGDRKPRRRFTRACSLRPSRPTSAVPPSTRCFAWIRPRPSSASSRSCTAQTPPSSRSPSPMSALCRPVTPPRYSPRNCPSSQPPGAGLDDRQPGGPRRRRGLHGHWQQPGLAGRRRSARGHQRPGPHGRHLVRPAASLAPWIGSRTPRNAVPSNPR